MEKSIELIHFHSAARQPEKVSNQHFDLLSESEWREKSSPATGGELLCIKCVNYRSRTLPFFYSKVLGITCEFIEAIKHRSSRFHSVDAFQSTWKHQCTQQKCRWSYVFAFHLAMSLELFNASAAMHEKAADFIIMLRTTNFPFSIIQAFSLFCASTFSLPRSNENFHEWYTLSKLFITASFRSSAHAVVLVQLKFSKALLRLCAQRMQRVIKILIISLASRQL